MTKAIRSLFAPMCMVNTTLNKADKIALALQVSKLFGCDVGTTDHFDGNRTKIAKDFLARWGREDLRYILADMSVSIDSPYAAVYSDINLGLVDQVALPTVAALTAALLQLSAYAALRRGSSFLAHQTSLPDKLRLLPSR
jgi:hypothetical protein